jgi:hypothetical protein
VRLGSRAFIVQQFSLSATAYWCPFCIQPRDIRLVVLESADAHLPDHRVRHLLQRRVGAAAPNGSASPDASVILCRPPCKGRPGTDRTTGGPPEALGASGETAEGCPVGARRAGASESLWKLKPSATSPEAETFPRLLNPKPNPPAAPGNAPPGQTQAPTKKQTIQLSSPNFHLDPLHRG